MTLAQTEPKKIYIRTGDTPRLPAEYQEVEYIQSSGTQYIDLGMQFTNNTKIDIDIAFTAARSGWSGIIGAQKENCNNSWAWGLNANTMTYQMSNSNTDHHIDWSWTPTLNTKYNFVLFEHTVQRDGVTVATISGALLTFTTPINAKLFRVDAQYNNGFAYNVSAAVYSLKIYENGTLVRDLVPCYRKADTVIGMYDLVNDVFYTNSGTGTFTKGNNIGGEQEIKKITIRPNGTEKQIRPAGGGWQPGANTLIYLPLETDVTDTTGNYTITNSNVTFNGGYAVFNGTSSKLVTTTDYGLTGNAAFTFSFWIYHNRNSVDVIFGKGPFSGQYNWVGCFINNNSLTIWRWDSDIDTGATISLNTRTHIVMTSDGTTTKIYQNGTLAYSNNMTYSIGNGSLGLGANFRANGNYYGGNISRFIGENVVRTSQEVSGYYNQTKGNYGL